MMMNRSYSLVLTRLVYALAALFVAMLGYLVFLEPPWLRYTNSPFPVLNSPVRAGESVALRVGRCSASRVTRVYALSRTLHCTHESIILPASLVSIDPGCIEVISRVSVVPPGTTSGTCHLVGYGEIQGVVRSGSIRWESQPFEVVP